MTGIGREQVWQHLERAVSPLADGDRANFEIGFSDAILQMWAAYLAEREGALGDRFGCVTPAEALAAHEILHAAQESGVMRSVVTLATS